jgi:hypothetical protein
MARTVRHSAWAIALIAAILAGRGRPAPSWAGQAPSVVIHTQDIWVFLPPDGGPDPFGELIAAADTAQTDLGDGFVFSPLPAASGVARRADGTPMDNVAISVGVLTLPVADGDAFRALAVFSTADIGAGQRNLDAGDLVSLAFIEPTTFTTDLETIAFAFLQTRMPEDPASEAARSPLEILAGRWQQRALHVLGSAVTGADLVRTPLRDPEAGAGTASNEMALNWKQQPTAIRGLTFDPKPSAGLPGGGVLAGAASEALNRLGEAVGWVDRQGARDYNDFLRAICTPECRFHLTGTITARAPHWEFRSTFNSRFAVGLRTGYNVPRQTGFTYGERAQNLRSEPCTVTPGAFEGPFQVRGRYDVRNRRLLITFIGEQPGRELYQYMCPPGTGGFGRLQDVETPSTAINHWWKSTDGQVLDFEVCDAMGSRPYTATFRSGAFTGEIEVTVSLEGTGFVITGIFGLGCQRGGPVLSSP